MQNAAPHRTRIKICGITRPRDAEAVVRAGADAIGLVFYARSPRAVDVATAQAITAVLPPFVSVVGLFVNAGEGDVREVMAHVPLDLLQFHGDEPPQECAGFGRRYLKAVRVNHETDLSHEAERFAGAAGLLLDAFDPGAYGGTGARFDWERIPPALAPRVVLAGGLDPDNVGEAVRRVRPYAVDVSSGVEASKGIKDPARIQAFVAAVRAVDHTNDEVHSVVR